MGRARMRWVTILSILSLTEKPHVFLGLAFLDDGGNGGVPFTGDDAFAVVIHFFFHGNDDLLDGLGSLPVQMEMFHDLRVPFEKLDGVPALQIRIAGKVFRNPGKGFFHRIVETDGLRRAGFRVFGRFDGQLYQFLDPGSLGALISTTWQWALGTAWPCQW